MELFSTPINRTTRGRIILTAEKRLLRKVFEIVFFDITSIFFALKLKE